MEKCRRKYRTWDNVQLKVDTVPSAGPVSKLSLIPMEVDPLFEKLHD